MPDTTPNKPESNRETASCVSRPESSRDFAELMRDLGEGSEDAAWILVERYTPHILRVVRAALPRAIRSKIDSVDIVNTLFGSLLLKRSYLARVEEPGQLLAILTKAARNRVIDEYRKYTRCASRDINSEEMEFAAVGDTAKGVAGDRRLGGREETPSQIVISREKWLRITRSLGDRDRRILSLRMEGATYEGIAREIGDVSQRTVRRVVTEVVDRLRS